MDTAKPKTVEEYLALARPEVRSHLERLRIAVVRAAPQAEERISYEMPAYRQEGILVYIGGFTSHVSLFPGPEAIAAFRDELAGYKTSGGTIRFPVDRPIPVVLVKKIVHYRLKQNRAKAAAKKKEIDS